MIFLIGFLGVCGYAFAKGSYNKVFIFADGDKEFCGHKNATGFNYLYFTEPSSGDTTNLFDYSICVDKCPTAKDDTIRCKTTKYVSVCPSSFHPTQTFLDLRICLPTGTASSVIQEIKNQLNDPDALKVLHPFTKNKWQIVGAWAIAIVLNFIYIKLMSEYPTAMSKASIVAIELLFVAMIIGFIVAKVP